MKTGDTLDRFTILKKLGHGGMGGVFIGFDHQSDELVAVKVLFQEYADDELYVKRFQREIAILRSLVHPNVVKLIDSGVDRDLHYMALEYVRGKPLSEVINLRKKLPLDIGLKLVKDTARALAYAHSNGIIHRDIKPANVMVIETNWTAKLLDFGVAYADDDLLQTSTGRFVGTLSYAAPEQVQGKPTDERADLYALGLLAYELLTGRKAILGTNQASILQQQLGDAYIPPNQAEPSLPPDLNTVILKLLRADPSQRYQKSDQFLYDLELFESRYKSMAFHSRSVYDFPEFVKEFQEANAAFEAKDFDNALRLGQDLARKAPRAAEAFFLLGKIHMERGFPYNAIKEYIKATAFDPDNNYYHLSLGIAYQAIGMKAQAKSEYETALHLDPNSRIVQQRLADLERGATSQSGPPPQSVAELNQSVPTNSDTAEFDREAALEQQKTAREPIVARLKELRPAARNRVQTAIWTMLWWGGGAHFLGQSRRVLGPSVLQAISLWIGIYLINHPAALRGLVGSTGALGGALDFLKDSHSITLVISTLYGLGTLYFVNESLHDAYLLGLQGFVIADKSERQWVTVNVGKDRGVRPPQVFHLFKEQKRGSGRGVLIGRVLVKDTSEDSASGPYFPDTREPPSLGDFAIAQETLRARLIDPEEPLPGRFPPVEFQEQPQEYQPPVLSSRH